MKSVFNMNFVYQNIELFVVDFNEMKNIVPIRYEQLSPDRDIFSFHAPIANKYYALYREDIIQSLEYGTQTIEAWWQSAIVSLIKAVNAPDELGFMCPDEDTSSFEYVAQNNNGDTLLLAKLSPPTFAGYHRDSYSSADGQSMIHYKG